MKHSATFTCIKYCIGVVLLAVQIKAEQCTTPNNETAECILLYSCPVLLNALMEDTNKSIEFVSQFNTCGGTPTNPLVCCGSSSEFRAFENKTKKLNYDLLPGKEYCGLQHSDEYFRSTNTTSIYEFPWIARIKYRHVNSKNMTLKFKCNASLINARYVLTTAHCINRKTLIAESVRLGEYHTKNKTDCVEEDSFFPECSEPVQDIEVEQLIPHPAFYERRILNDIGLIRLKKNVHYTDYIRPICLPIPGTKLSEIGDMLVTSGWGGMLESDDGEVAIKKKVFARIITNEQCTTAYNNSRFSANKGHLCTILFSNNTDLVCQGDSGSPVMVARGLNWYQEAIISTGTSASCAGDTIPEIHTNVAHFMEWIAENIRP